MQQGTTCSTHPIPYPGLLLQALLSPSAQCKRDGKWQEIEARELVPGDLIQLKGGDVIPADAKVAIPPILKPFPCRTYHAVLCSQHQVLKMVTVHCN